jgi:hypothetical protein
MAGEGRKDRCDPRISLPRRGALSGPKTSRSSSDAPSPTTYEHPSAAKALAAGGIRSAPGTLQQRQAISGL